VERRQAVRPGADTVGRRSDEQLTDKKQYQENDARWKAPRRQDLSNPTPSQAASGARPEPTMKRALIEDASETAESRRTIFDRS
jgi:hypothetical protein